MFIKKKTSRVSLQLAPRWSKCGGGLHILPCLAILYIILYIPFLLLLTLCSCLLALGVANGLHRFSFSYHMILLVSWILLFIFVSESSRSMRATCDLGAVSSKALLLVSKRKLIALSAFCLSLHSSRYFPGSDQVTS